MTTTEVVDLSEYDDELGPQEPEEGVAGDGSPDRGRSRDVHHLPRPWLAVTVRVLVTVSLLAGWTVAYGLGLSALQENRSQAQMYAALREALADPQAEPTGAIPPGTPIALLDGPRPGLHDLVVVEGTASGDLQSGPGHRRDTVLPGQPGVSVIMGRSGAYGAPFRAITALKSGDRLVLTTEQGTFTYRVDRVRHAGDPLPVPLTGTQGRLTLVTSLATGWRSGWAPSGTVYVDATLLTAPVAIPAGRPASVPVAEQPMQGDSTALMPLVLWLQGLVLVALAVVWGRARWGRWQTWLVGAPLLLAVLWGATSTAAQLLPNLL